MVKHFVDFRGSRREATWEWPTDPRQIHPCSYIEGSRAYETCRFARTGHLPLRLEFSDATNARHTIVIERNSDTHTVAMLCTSQILWHGDENDRTDLTHKPILQKSLFLTSQGTFSTRMG